MTTTMLRRKKKKRAVPRSRRSIFHATILVNQCYCIIDLIFLKKQQLSCGSCHVVRTQHTFLTPFNSRLNSQKTTSRRRRRREGEAEMRPESSSLTLQTHTQGSTTHTQRAWQVEYIIWRRDKSKVIRWRGRARALQHSSNYSPMTTNTILLNVQGPQGSGSGREATGQWASRHELWCRRHELSRLANQHETLERRRVRNHAIRRFSFHWTIF